MALRRFPLPLRVGTDICNVARVQKVISRRAKDNKNPALARFLKRILTPPERAYFWQRFGSSSSLEMNLGPVSEYLAGRFAAKEAIRKACNHFDLSSRGFHQILILPISSYNTNDYQSTRPQGLILDEVYQEETSSNSSASHDAYEIDGITLQSAVDGLEGQLCEVSITHDAGLAVAVAIVPAMEKASDHHE